MRKIYFLTGVFFLLFIFNFDRFSFASNGETLSNQRMYNWQQKLKRGALNVVSSPVEIAREINMTTNEKNLLNGWTVGLVKGLGSGFMRFGAGALDVLTCPFNFPDSKKGSLIEPEYVWEKPGPKYN